MRILVCGGRDFGVGVRAEYDFVYNTLTEKLQDPTDEYGMPYGDTVIIHGGARGVDSIADEWAITHWARVEFYPANWEKDGKAAGFIRNQRMIDEGKPDIVFAFPGGKGTRDMVTRAKRHNIPVMEFHYDCAH